VGGSREELVERLFGAGVGMIDLLTIYVGDRLGCYVALRDRGPMTPPELAVATGINVRYAREWLEQQAASAILDVGDPADDEYARRYSLSPGHAEVLTDPESPYSMAPFARSLVAASRATAPLLDAFRSGGGVAWEAYGQDMVEAQGDFNRPWLRASLGTEYLPSIPDVHDRLRSPGARVADVACGVGWAGISIAQAYPEVRVDGFDPDEASITLATTHAVEAGVDDRVTFHAREAGDPALEGSYDVAIVVEAIHDMSRPVEVLRSIRRILKPDGTLIVADERTEDAFTAPASEVERVFYGYSVLCCLPSSMDEQPSAATGTVMRRSTFEAYARDAGFAQVTVLPIEHDLLRFYRLDPSSP
jgi:2-polyprenyl-3-methyl-5-hydroxy-6-metoxy-1,4-benzoquinol methylase